MKYLLYILVPIIVILIVISAILFTPSGSNAVIKPIANGYLAQKIKKPKITIKKLDSEYKYINMQAVADNGLNIEAKGDVDYFSKKFDINYKLKAQKLKVEDRELAVKMDINGQAVGSVKNFGVVGKGRAFESGVDYKFIVKNQKPESINAKVSGAQLSQIFAMANMLPLADGYAFVDINMPSLDIKNPSGNALVEIKEGRFNRNLIAKKYNIKLLKDEKFSAKLDAQVVKKYIVGSGKIDTTTAKLTLSKLTTTLDFLISKGYYSLNIQDLSRLNTIAKQRLRGSLKADGIFYVNAKKGAQQATAKTKSFGGLAKVFYANNSVKANLKNVSIIKVLHTIYMPYYVSSGVVNGSVVIPNLKSLNGQFAISSNGKLNPKMLKIKLPSYNYRVATNGSLKNGVVYAKKSSISTSFAKVYLSKTKYSLLTKALSSNFTADIKELAALNKITNQHLRGALRVHGKVEQAGSAVNLIANTKSLGGVVKLHYKNGSLSSSLKGVKLPKLLYMAYQPHLLKSGIVNGVVKLSSTTPLNGLFSIASKGSIDNHTLQKVYNINLGNNFRYALNIKDGVIKKGVIIAKPTLNTTVGSVNFSKFVYNTKNSNLSAKYRVHIDDLSKLEPITKQKFNGSLDIDGNIKQSPNNLLVTGIAKEFGGNVNYILHNDNLTLDAAGVSVVKVTKMLGYPEFLDAISKVHFEYNLKSKSGTYQANLNDARFLNSKFVNMLKTYAHFDLAKELFSNAKISGSINDSLVTINVNTSSQRTKIVINGAKINTKAKTINAKVYLTYNGNEYPFKVTGAIDDPTIRPVFGGYIKKKIKKKFLDKIGKKFLGKETNTSGVKEQIEQKAQKKVEDKIKKAIPKEVKGIFKNLLHQ